MHPQGDKTMIDQATIDRILDAAQIVEVVSDFVTLRKRGVNYVGLCPFHNEKTPSFSVSPSKGLCKCFSCGKGENSLAVDAACSGNPGAMEYRGVHVASRQEIFHFGPVYGTNNIGEFLAIVHGLALLKQKGFDMPIYSDSVNAISWIKQKKCKTKLPREPKTEELFKLIERAEKWLRENTYTTKILKWETKQWGEIPADFGRK